MKDIIHIGYPKTATTWFQNVFFNQVKNRSLLSRDFINEILTEQNAFNFNVKKIKNKLINYHPYIISHEGLIGNMHNFGMNGFMTIKYAERLRQISDNPFIIIFIRNQYEIILSTYLQYVRNGGTYGIKQYLYHKSFLNNKDAYLFSLEFFKYDRVISLYKSLFGEKNVKVYLYEDFYYNSNQFLKNFLLELDLNMDIQSLKTNPINVSYKKRTYLFGRFLNLFSKEGMIFKYYLFNIPGWYRRSKNFLDWFNRHFGGREMKVLSFFNEEERRFMHQYFSESNKILLEKHKLLNLKKYKYPL